MTSAPQDVEPPKQQSRIVLVNSIVQKNDAISASVRDTTLFLLEKGYDVTVFCYKSDYADIPAVVVQDVNQLLMHDAYLSADLIIWHFGIFYELFNACLLGNGHARQVVCFHNITPKEFTPENSWALLDSSVQQAHLMGAADEVWAVSEINAHYAHELGVPPTTIHVIPLAVEDTPLASLKQKQTDIIQLLYVGRFVQAKGVMELLEAVDTLVKSGAAPRFKLTLVGNVSFSDPQYVKKLQHFIDERKLHKVVDFQGTIDDLTLQDLYVKSHILAIPSYHEGFCKPVIEALRTGCIPVGYTSYNLPYIVNGFGRLVKTGDVDALTQALGQILTAIPKSLTMPQAVLPLDAGDMNIDAFEKQVSAYIQNFTSQQVGDLIMERIKSLLAARPSTRPR